MRLAGPSILPALVIYSRLESNLVSEEQREGVNDVVGRSIRREGVPVDIEFTRYQCPEGAAVHHGHIGGGGPPWPAATEHAGLVSLSPAPRLWAILCAQLGMLGKELV
jgi:hypothetical protein